MSPRVVAWSVAPALLATAISVTGCRQDAQPGALAGASPLDVTPVGPLPGPAHALLPANPYDGDPVALQEGRRLFVRFNCSGCHGGHAGGGMGPSLRDADWIYGSQAARIHGSIAEGRAHGMPAWGRLPDDQIWKLTAYIQSLGTDAEPQPPQ